MYYIQNTCCIKYTVVTSCNYAFNVDTLHTVQHCTTVLQEVNTVQVLYCMYSTVNILIALMQAFCQKLKRGGGRFITAKPPSPN